MKGEAFDTFKGIVLRTYPNYTDANMQKTWNTYGEWFKVGLKYADNTISKINVDRCISYGIVVKFHDDGQYPAPYAQASCPSLVKSAVAQTVNEAVELLVKDIRGWEHDQE